MDITASRLAGALALILPCWLSAANAALAPTTLALGPKDVGQLSIEELAEIDISSVSKRAEPLSDAPAAIFVITREDIRRASVTSVPELLRLAPNLQVARSDAAQYAISARGFNSTSSNKLLVLIDGRSVYTPLFSGVFWDAQHLPLDLIERIEVISGPGGALWGSNAVNGVINIITRQSQDTPGTRLALRATNDEAGGGALYGNTWSEHGAYRLYADGFDHDHTRRANGVAREDAWQRGQIGYRVDWIEAGDTLTFQGDAYKGSEDQTTSAIAPGSNRNKTITGGNLLGRWQHPLSNDSDVQLQLYWDRVHRDYPGTFAETRDTVDLDVQHHFRWRAAHDIVWGGGYRKSHEDIGNTSVLAFLPAKRGLTLANAFVQDTQPLSERLKLTLGVKSEHNSYTGLEWQPNARLAWKVSDAALLWSAVSRAVRTPSRIDRDFYVTSPPIFFAGGPGFQSEKVIAYELGYRGQPLAGATLSVSTFYNVYNDLRSTELLPGNTIIFANKLEGHGYGGEAWGSYRLAESWQLSAGYSYLHKNLNRKADSTDASSVASNTDPRHQASLRSRLNLPRNLELDLGLRYVDELRKPPVPDYLALDLRLGWHLGSQLEVALIGNNLLDERHAEFIPSATNLANHSESERTWGLTLSWTF